MLTVIQILSVFCIEINIDIDLKQYQKLLKHFVELTKTVRVMFRAKMVIQVSTKVAKCRKLFCFKFFKKTVLSLLLLPQM